MDVGRFEAEHGIVGTHLWFVDLQTSDLFDGDGLKAGAISRVLEPYLVKLKEIAVRGRHNAIIGVHDALPSASPGGVLISCDDEADGAAVRAQWPNGYIPTFEQLTPAPRP